MTPFDIPEDRDVAHHTRRMDPLAERRRTLVVQSAVMSVLAIVALILVIAALQVP
jgi:hypothetical protein